MTENHVSPEFTSTENNTNSDPSNQRRYYFLTSFLQYRIIDRSFQLKLLMFILSLNIVTVGIYILFGDKWFLSIPIILFITCIYTLILSLKIAGPLYKIQNYMKDATQNKNYSPIQFRKGDFFGPLKDTYNDLINSINKDKNGGSAN
jgi:hypothetical protein